MIRQRLKLVGDLQTNVKPEAFHANAIVVLVECNCFVWNYRSIFRGVLGYFEAPLVG